MTTFADVHSTGVIGTSYTVTDGTSPPPGSHNSREFQEWRGRNFSGVLVAKVDGPPRQLQVTLDDYAVTVTICEPTVQGADITALALDQQSLSSPSAIVFVDSSGTVTSALPIQVQATRYKGMTDVTDAATWTCSYDPASFSVANGLFSFTAVPGTATIEISSTYDGKTLSNPFTITRVAAATSSTSTTTSGSSQSNGSLTGVQITGSTIAASVVAATVPNVVQRAGVQISLSMSINFQVSPTANDRDGVGNIFASWQYRLSGSTDAWTTVGSEQISDTQCSWDTSTNSGSDGLLNQIESVQLLTTGSAYDFQILLRQDSLSSTMDLPFVVTQGVYQVSS